MSGLTSQISPSPSLKTISTRGTSFALGWRVNNKEKFTVAVNWLVREDEKRQRADARETARIERRDRIFGHARGIFILLLLAAVALFVNNYWNQMTGRTGSKSGETAEGKASGTLQGARQAAASRDAIVDEVTK